jgi:hypothetical protein
MLDRSRKGFLGESGEMLHRLGSGTTVADTSDSAQ